MTKAFDMVVHATSIPITVHASSLQEAVEKCQVYFYHDMGHGQFHLKDVELISIKED